MGVVLLYIPWFQPSTWIFQNETTNSILAGEGGQAQDALLPGQEGGGVREGEGEAEAVSLAAGEAAAEGALAGEGKEGAVQVGGEEDVVTVQIAREEKESEEVEVS